jgi:putative endonuclease
LNLPPQELGSWGEKVAAEFLVEQGYTIVCHNERTPYGEIDLVTQQPQKSTPGGCITVFVEVKTRRSKTFGYPEESITSSKQEHLISAASHFLQEHPEMDQDWRIDVIAIESYDSQKPIIHHFENAIHE